MKMGTPGPHFHYEFWDPFMKLGTLLTRAVYRDNHPERIILYVLGTIDDNSTISSTLGQSSHSYVASLKPVMIRWLLVTHAMSGTTPTAWVVNKFHHKHGQTQLLNGLALPVLCSYQSMYNAYLILFYFFEILTIAWGGPHFHERVPNLIWDWGPGSPNSQDTCR